MNYKKYQNSRDLAWLILKREKIRALPVDIIGLCKRMGIVVKYMNDPQGGDGCSTMVGGTPYIFIKSGQSRERSRFTIAHELGHILLGHVGKYRLVNREPAHTDDPIEQEANVFASRLLAPACVLWGCGVQSAQDIARLCDISRTAAEYRWARMQVLYQRNKFLVSPLEKKVYAGFKKFIESQRP